jgi:hypothetical protein
MLSAPCDAGGAEVGLGLADVPEQAATTSATAAKADAARVVKVRVGSITA